MRKLLIKFLLFLAVLEGLGRINLPSLVLALALGMALVACIHILATPKTLN